MWLAFLAIAGVGLTIKDARLDAAEVRGAGGALAETPNEAALYQGALDWIARETRPGEPIFVAPLMPSLYTRCRIARTRPISSHPSWLARHDRGRTGDDSDARRRARAARDHR